MKVSLTPVLWDAREGPCAVVLELKPDLRGVQWDREQLGGPCRRGAGHHRLRGGWGGDWTLRGAPSCGSAEARPRAPGGGAGARGGGGARPATSPSTAPPAGRPPAAPRGTVRVLRSPSSPVQMSEGALRRLLRGGCRRRVVSPPGGAPARVRRRGRRRAPGPGRPSDVSTGRTRDSMALLPPSNRPAHAPPSPPAAAFLCPCFVSSPRPQDDEPQGEPVVRR